MYIVISGAWPEPAIAKELASHIEKQAPTLARWLANGKASTHKSDANHSKCIPLEDWMLQTCEFNPEPNQHISAGLGPLTHNVDNDEQVWLADLVHMSPSRDGAALLAADTLHISAEQANILLNDARDFFTDDGFSFSPTAKPYTWQIHWPDAVSFACASPALVAISSVNDWWPEADSARPWRRLVNSLQMAWYEHPINLERQNQGLPPINSMWLYGGARKAQLKSSLPADTQIFNDLHHYLIAQDWGGWLAALEQLEQNHLSKITAKSFELVLTGREHYANITVRHNLLNKIKPHNWRQWWSSQL